MRTKQTGLKLAGLLATVSVFAAGAGLSAQPVARAADAPQVTDAAKQKISVEDFLGKPQSVTSNGSVTVHGAHIDYEAVSGTLIVHKAGWDDSERPEADKEKSQPEAAASMYYVAYFKKGVRPENRPITFVYNGGPGSSSVWLHMGAFGPKRVVTSDDSHTPAAPYAIVNNNDSLLDVTDLVFIDAPGTGYGRLIGKDKEKAFWGTDRMPVRSRTLSRSSSPVSGVTILPNICLAKATARRGLQLSPISWRMIKGLI